MESMAHRNIDQKNQSFSEPIFYVEIVMGF